MKKIAKAHGVKVEDLSVTIKNGTFKNEGGTRTDLHIWFDGIVYDELSWNSCGKQHFLAELYEKARVLGYDHEFQTSDHLLLFKWI